MLKVIRASLFLMPPLMDDADHKALNKLPFVMNQKSAKWFKSPSTSTIKNSKRKNKLQALGYRLGFDFLISSKFEIVMAI